jgi:hypothetical protein
MIAPVCTLAFEAVTLVWLCLVLPALCGLKGTVSCVSAIQEYINLFVFEEGGGWKIG